MKGLNKMNNKEYYVVATTEVRTGKIVPMICGITETLYKAKEIALATRQQQEILTFIEINDHIWQNDNMAHNPMFVITKIEIDFS